MEWTVLYDDDFIEWLEQQQIDLQDVILGKARSLGKTGPLTGRPLVGTIRGSKYFNLKELIVQHRGIPWRVFFAFDPNQDAVILVGDNKKGQDEKRWYRKIIKEAEQRYEKHLKEIGKYNG